MRHIPLSSTLCLCLSVSLSVSLSLPPPLIPPPNPPLSQRIHAGGCKQQEDEGKAAEALDPAALAAAKQARAALEQEKLKLSQEMEVSETGEGDG